MRIAIAPRVSTRGLCSITSLFIDKDRSVDVLDQQSIADSASIIV